MTKARRPDHAPSLPEPSSPIGFEEEGTAYEIDAPTNPAARETGPDVIKSYLSRLPDGPGVYRMLDAKGEVLYVGKARSLRNRVASYTRYEGHTTRIQRMISNAASLVAVVTRTETEALLLESNLIKRLKPRYNVLLRDDKSFPYILIEGGHDFPRLRKHRGAKSVDGRYFGPFASAGSVNRTLNHLQKAFLLRSCNDSTFDGRTRPCLLYQIKRCCAPCVDYISPEEYKELSDEAFDFLEGKSTSVQERLAAEMNTAAADMDYERAAIFRDRIKALTQVQSHQGVNPRGVDEADVVALHMENGQACVQVFFFRGGQNWGNKAYFPRLASDADEAEVLAAFLGQFYDTRPPAKSILLSHEPGEIDLLQAALTEAAGHKITLAMPARGEKRELVADASRNAREALARRMADSAAQGRLLDGLVDAFDLNDRPSRIEVYDNSHIMGTDAVGAMIVSGPDGLQKNQYRKFNIKGTDLTPGDDFGMMREVLTRRFSRLMKEDPDREKGNWPDLVLIDGGQGQLTATLETLGELGVEDVAVVAVAKGQERDAGKEMFYRHGHRPKALPHRDPTLYFLQRLRDEAHRFAIGTHRAKRAKSQMVNPLDEIGGVGPARKRALLAHFGSAKAVSRAGVTDLAAVEGVSKAMAQKVYDHFHGE